MKDYANTKCETMAQGTFPPMTPEFPDVSAQALFVKGANSLSVTIAHAKTAEQTERYLSLGAYVRRDYIAGHSNTSLSSTTKGALSVAQGIVGDIHIPETTSEQLFGENIRETYYFFKRMIKMFKER